MPRDKDRKRIIRRPMKKTGESSTTARAHVIAKTGAQQPPAPVPDHAALAGTSDDTIAARTGRSWQEWVRVLDADRAATLPHRDIAALVHEKHRVPDWWAQTLTVGYERIKGLRERGRRRGGAYRGLISTSAKADTSGMYRAPEITASQPKRETPTSAQS